MDDWKRSSQPHHQQYSQHQSQHHHVFVPLHVDRPSSLALATTSATEPLASSRSRTLTLTGSPAIPPTSTTSNNKYKGPSIWTSPLPAAPSFPPYHSKSSSSSSSSSISIIKPIEALEASSYPSSNDVPVAAAPFKLPLRPPPPSLPMLHLADPPRAPLASFASGRAAPTLFPLPPTIVDYVNDTPWTSSSSSRALPSSIPTTSTTTGVGRESLKGNGEGERPYSMLQPPSTSYLYDSLFPSPSVVPNYPVPGPNLSRTRITARPWQPAERDGSLIITLPSQQQQQRQPVVITREDQKNVSNRDHMTSKASSSSTNKPYDPFAAFPSFFDDPNALPSSTSSLSSSISPSAPTMTPAVTSSSSAPPPPSSSSSVWSTRIPTVNPSVQPSSIGWLSAAPAVTPFAPSSALTISAVPISPSPPPPPLGRPLSNASRLVAASHVIADGRQTPLISLTNRLQGGSYPSLGNDDPITGTTDNGSGINTFSSIAGDTKRTDPPSLSISRQPVSALLAHQRPPLSSLLSVSSPPSVPIMDRRSSTHTTVSSTISPSKPLATDNNNQPNDSDNLVSSGGGDDISIARVVVNLDQLEDPSAHYVRFNGHDDARAKLNEQIMAAIELANGVEDEKMTHQRLEKEAQERAIHDELSRSMPHWPAGALPIFVPLPGAGLTYPPEHEGTLPTTNDRYGLEPTWPRPYQPPIPSAPRRMFLTMADLPYPPPVDAFKGVMEGQAFRPQQIQRIQALNEITI
jgi:hypothetical protein